MSSPTKKNCFNRLKPRCPSHCALPTRKYLGKSNKNPNPCTYDLYAIPGITKSKRRGIEINESQIKKISCSVLKKNISLVENCIKKRQNDLGCYSSLIKNATQRVRNLEKQISRKDAEILDATMWKKIKTSKRLNSQEEIFYQKYSSYSKSFEVIFENQTHRFVINTLKQWLEIAYKQNCLHSRSRSRSPRRTNWRRRSRSRSGRR